MIEKRIVALCETLGQFERIQRLLTGRTPARLCGFLQVDDLEMVLNAGQTGLVLCFLNDPQEYNVIARALWHVSRTRHRVPLVVLTPTYDTASALTLLQMGATDYMSLEDHGNRLPEVVATLLTRGAWRPSSFGSEGSISSAPISDLTSAWSKVYLPA
ncbi:MAG: hypothetical protein U0794_05190 [Isosphaeraceae bacterium]